VVGLAHDLSPQRSRRGGEAVHRRHQINRQVNDKGAQGRTTLDAS
jgi:hypothetical protein